MLNQSRVTFIALTACDLAPPALLLATGLTPRTLLEKFTAIQMIDVYLVGVIVPIILACVITMMAAPATIASFCRVTRLQPRSEDGLDRPQ